MALVTRVARWLALAVVAVFTLLEMRSYVPGNETDTFNSDDAIPLLMANAPHLKGFSLYYWGQDRWGAWPMLAMNLVHRATGFAWAMMSFHVAICAAVLMTAVMVWRLGGRFGVPLALTFLVSSLVWTLPVLQIAQPYAWQNLALVGAWLAFRAALTDHPRWLIVAAVAGFLSAWSSPTSTLCLPVLFALEAVVSPRETRAVGLAAATSFAAVVSALLIQVYFHRYAQRTFGWAYTTPVALDRGYWSSNISIGVSRIPAGAWAIGGIGLGLLVAVQLARRPWRREYVTALGFLWIAFASFVPAVAFSWVRLNEMSGRYFFDCTIFLVSAGTLLALTALDAELVGLLAVTVAAGSVMFAIPSAQISHEQVSELALAEQIAGHSDAPIVLGEYWSVYELAGARYQPALTPIVLQGQFDRMPWTKLVLHSGETVFVLRKQGTPAPLALEEYDFSLRLLEPAAAASDSVVVATYLVGEKRL